jgi:hypothetical protein
MPETDSAQHPNLYRAITKKRWYDATSRKVSSAAFILRSRETGLSVLKAVGCSREICHAGLGECFGEFVLQTIRVRDLGLAVVDDEPDALDFSENHAEITELPINPVTDEERRRAEDLATDLANLSSLHYDRNDNYTS